MNVKKPKAASAFKPLKGSFLDENASRLIMGMTSCSGPQSDPAENIMRKFSMYAILVIEDEMHNSGVVCPVLFNNSKCPVLFKML
jgi:hypothetical protein